MTLHTLSAAPSSAAFGNCLHLIDPADALLLLGDGVYAGIRETPARRALEATGASLFALDADAAAAGLASRLDGITLVDIDGFVALSERHVRQLAWY